MTKMCRAASLLPLLASVHAQWTLNLLSSTDYPLARCLDGSMGGYYISPGSLNTSFLIHTQGGGWCVSDDDCANRAKTPLGSSSAWGAGGCPDANSPVCYADGGANGMLSDDPTSNPNLYAFTKVFVNYCDGSSYASDVQSPVTVGSQTIYYRGSYILDAVYKELYLKHGLDSARSVIVSGCSAGGLAVYAHVDRICDLIHENNPGAVCRGAPGAGFFMGEEKPYSGNGYLANYQWVYQRMNVSVHTNSACLAANAATPWKCFIAPEILPYIQTPLFISNSLTDSWQSGNIMGLGCTPTKEGACNAAQIAYLQQFRADMLTALAPVRTNSKHGGFLTGCFVHVVEDVSTWSTELIHNATQAQTFWSWWNGEAARLQIGDFPPWSNPTC